MKKCRLKEFDDNFNHIPVSATLAESICEIVSFLGLWFKSSFKL